MSNLPFTLRQLEVFESLANTRSFRRTAELLGISQASVSSQLKVLEDQLGIELFDRKPGRRPILLPEGLAFLDDLREFRVAAARLASHRRARAEKSTRAARFRLLVGQGMFDTYIRRKLDSFFADNPQIDLEFETRLPYGTLFEAVETGQFDFALINQRSDLPPREGFREIAMVRGGIYGHRKFAEGRELPLAKEVVNRLPFILLKANARQERDVLRNYQMNGIHPHNVVGHTQYYDVLAGMLDKGLGIASFSEAILPHAMRQNVILLLGLEDWRLLFYRRDRTPDAVRDEVERFLISSLIDDPEYPAVRN